MGIRFILGARFSKVPKLLGPEKPFVKLRPAYSVKLVFWYVVKIMKIKITATFRVSERLHFEVIKRLMSPEKFRDFRETVPFLKWLSIAITRFAITTFRDWLINLAPVSTNKTKKQSHLVRTIFPAHWENYKKLLGILIGSLRYLFLLELARVISLLLVFRQPLENRSMMMGETKLAMHCKFYITVNLTRVFV